MRTEDYQDLFELEEELWWFVGMRQITAAVLDPLLRENVSRIVLDAGCGTGGNVAWLRRYAGASEVVGMDLASDALKFARQRVQQLPVQASVTELPFPDATFDLVTSFDVIVQLPEEGADERAIREMYRVLTPGGIAFVRAAAYQWMRSGHDVALDTRRRYSLNELRALLEGTGFRVIRATYANSLLLPIAALHRLALKPIGLAPSGSDVSPLPSGLRWINPIFQTLLRCEAVWLKLFPLPAGLSVICVVQKPNT
ncbi:MAG TPA: class I SAM-dependent methyltransferase [Pyrinomonadaceae bacterium]|nr:class I SAM-dependent methyltransferase [Pyrinomonadaceae bacterium]